jgi:hypothetical protein
MSKTAIVGPKASYPEPKASDGAARPASPLQPLVLDDDMVYRLLSVYCAPAPASPAPACPLPLSEDETLELMSVACVPALRALGRKYVLWPFDYHAAALVATWSEALRRWQPEAGPLLA